VKTGPLKTDETLVRLILQYLIEHPDAKDTLEGILKWWLPEAQGEWGKEDVQKGLHVLTSKGWLLRLRTSPSEEIYGVNKDKLAEIRTFLSREGNWEQV
jgi:hypothetical protein